MSIHDTLKVMNKIAAEKSTNNLQTGKIARERSNDIYDAIVMGDKTIEMPSLKPVDTNEKYKKDDSVFIGVPYGEEGLLRILSKSNIEIPDEKEHRFRTKTISEGTIYLACPNDGDGLIKVYSLDGTPGTDISPEINAMYNLCTDGTYLYFSSCYAYRLYKVKPDGSDFIEIVSQSRYYDAPGLAINAASTHLYTAYSVYGDPIGIARINISTGEVEETELTGVSFSEIVDLCGDGVYLYLLGHNIEADKIAVYDFNLNFVREISVSDIFEKITSDGTNIYLSNSSKVDIYTVSGTFVGSISESGIQAVAVKNGKIYIVTESSEGG